MQVNILIHFSELLELPLYFNEDSGRRWQGDRVTRSGRGRTKASPALPPPPHVQEASADDAQSWKREVGPPSALGREGCAGLSPWTHPCI